MRKRWRKLYFFLHMFSRTVYTNNLKKWWVKWCECQNHSNNLISKNHRRRCTQFCPVRYNSRTKWYSAFFQRSSDGVMIRSRVKNTENALDMTENHRFTFLSFIITHVKGVILFCCYKASLFLLLHKASRPCISSFRAHPTQKNSSKATLWKEIIWRRRRRHMFIKICLLLK